MAHKDFLTEMLDQDPEFLRNLAFGPAPNPTPKYPVDNELQAVVTAAMYDPDGIDASLDRLDDHDLIVLAGIITHAVGRRFSFNTKDQTVIRIEVQDD